MQYFFIADKYKLQEDPSYSFKFKASKNNLKSILSSCIVVDF